MIEKTILDFLEYSLPDVPIYMERPEEKPQGMYIIIDKTGSKLVNHLPTATIAVQSYAPTLYEAAQLNEAVKAILLGSVTEDNISAVRLQTDYNYTDTATKQPRYQAVFDFYYME